MYEQQATTLSVEQRVSPRYVWSVLLAVVGMFILGIGVAVLFGGAWTAVVVGAVFIMFALVLALPDKKMWG